MYAFKLTFPKVITSNWKWFVFNTISLKYLFSKQESPSEIFSFFVQITTLQEVSGVWVWSSLFSAYNAVLHGPLFD